jgi:four helix bundle protein
MWLLRYSMALASLRVYKTAATLADRVSAIVQSWNHFDTTTLGHQLVRAADSITNNISEGYGRVATGERLQFYMYAKGSNLETLNCLERAFNRNLITHQELKSLSRMSFEISMSLVELAHADLQKDSSYRGPYRDRIEKLRHRMRSHRKNSE